MSFEEQFFGSGNRLRWQAIRDGTLAPDVRERLSPFLHELRANPDVLVLPRVLEKGRVQWYMLCSSARFARIARDEIRAFLGPSYSDFEGQPSHMNDRDSVEAAVLDRCGENAFRLEISNPALFETARSRLLLLIRLRNERPKRHASLVRPSGRILRDFEYALLARDGNAALECIRELDASGRLTTANLVFLRIRRFAALGDWTEILALPELNSILLLPRPRRVTEDLIRAVYAGELRRFEQGSRAEEALATFRSEVLPRYAELYASRAGLAGFEVDVSFMLAAIVSEARSSEIDAIIAAYPEGVPGAPYLRTIAALKQVARASTGLASPLQQAQAALAAVDIDKAFELAAALPSSFDRSAILLRCAREMGTLAAAAVALGSLNSLAPDDQARIRGNAILVRILGELVDLKAPAPFLTPAEPLLQPVSFGLPTSWAQWLIRLTNQERWNGALQVADAGSREWEIADYLSNPAKAAEVADLLLAARPAWGQSAFRDSLPYLLGFFFSCDPDPRLRSIYENLFLAIATDNQTSAAQVLALAKIGETTIALGVDASTYGDILTQLASALEDLDSPVLIEPALEIIDMLIDLPSVDSVARQTFLINIVSLFQRWYQRIDSTQWNLLRRYCDELQLPQAVKIVPPHFDAEVTDNPWSQLNGKKLALYSLRQTALQRVENVLMEICPRVSIQSFNDLVGGSPALRNAAAVADIFVLAVAAAKHAATQFILANRPKTQTTLYARSQGSASILEVLRGHLRASNSDP